MRSSTGSRSEWLIDMRVLTFTGVLLASGEFHLPPGFILDGVPTSDAGEVDVEVYSRGGRLLASTKLALVTPCVLPLGESEDESNCRTTVGMVDFPEGASELRVLIDGEPVLERTAPVGNLDVSVDWPASLSEGASVTWRVPKDDALASLGYSADGGRTWSPLSLPTSSTAIEFETATLPGGDDCVLELIVTDGFTTRRLRSGAYELERRGWVIWIFSPVPGATLRSTQAATLAAQAYQLEEHRAGFDEIQWSSSLDGGLGVGAQLEAELSVGDHIVTAALHGVSAEVAVTVSN